MPFTSLLFLCAFLPLFLIAYWVVRPGYKNGVALGFSLLFFGWGAPAFLPVVLALGCIDYLLTHAIAKSDSARRRKQLLLGGITLHLSVLAYFKYSNFFVNQLNHLLPSALALKWSAVALPIGVSFLTFEEISCICDVYRGDAKPARTVWHYLLFLMLFPHSIAGPIFRWKDLEKQLQTRSESLSQIQLGVQRFCLGLGKKVLIANSLALIVDPIFALQIPQLRASLSWLAAFAFTLEIYFDFSGYSDMAIGLGNMAGFTFKENFNQPYTSASLAEFWRRWHISLSSWMRDYLFIPLGGNRVGEGRLALNLFIVFLLSGFWHGANWTFVIWGAYHGLLIAAERTGPIKALKAAMPRAANIALTFTLVLIALAIFRSPDFNFALHFVGTLFGIGPTPVALPVTMLPGDYLAFRSVAMLVLGTGVTFYPLLRAATNAEQTPGAHRSWEFALRYAGALVSLVLSLAYLTNSKFTPLIYFKF